LNPLETLVWGALTWLLYSRVTPIIASTLGLNENDVTNEAGKLALSMVASYLVIHYFGQILIAGTEIASDFTRVIEWLIITRAVSGAAAPSTFWSMPTTAGALVTLVPTSPPETWGKTYPRFVSGANP
jgi:hypothetical protein